MRTATVHVLRPHDRLHYPVYYCLLLIFAGVTTASVVFDAIDLTTWIEDDDSVVMQGIVNLLVFGRSVDKASHR